jgi:hypothetical protein
LSTRKKTSVKGLLPQLVETAWAFEVPMLFHIHTLTVSTWNHVLRVEKNVYPTPKQTPKNNATQKSSRILKQSCGAP